MACGQYVQLELSGAGMVWTVMGEFANGKHKQIRLLSISALDGFMQIKVRPAK